MDVLATKRTIKHVEHSVSGLFPFNGSDIVPFESTLERDFLIRLESYPNILCVESQPITIKFSNQEGGYNLYTPDFLVQFKSHPWPYTPSQLIEVKPNNILFNNLSNLKPKYKAAIRYCKLNHYVFHFMDEYRIRDQRWKNAMFLRRYKKFHFDIKESNWILDTLRSMGSTSFDYLLTKLFIGDRNRAIGISHLWHLISLGRIQCDLSLSLNQFSELWLPASD